MSDPFMRREAEAPLIGLLFAGPRFLRDRLFWAGAAEGARNQGASLIGLCGGMLGDPLGFAREANKIFSLAASPRFDALVAWTGEMSIRAPEGEITSLLDGLGDIPVICAGARAEGRPLVIRDGFSGEREAVLHLIRVHGRRRIAFVRGSTAGEESETLLAAYREALMAGGLSFDPGLVVEDSSVESPGARALAALLDGSGTWPDAIACDDDATALGILAGLHDRGIDVPGRIALIGFGDGENAARSDPGLSSVRYSVRELGRVAVEAAAAATRGKSAPAESLLPMELAVRGSCGCAEIRRTELRRADGRSTEGDKIEDPFHNAVLDLEREQEAVSSVMEEAAVELELDGLCAAIARRLPDLGIRRFSLLMNEGPAEKPGRELRLVAGFTEEGPSVDEDSVLPSSGFPFFEEGRRAEAIAFPLCLRDETFGLALAELPEKSTRLCEALRGPLSRAIKSALLLKEGEKTKAKVAEAYARVDLINRLGSRMASLLDVPILLKSAAELIREEFGLFAVVVYLSDDGREDEEEGPRPAYLRPAFASFASDASAVPFDPIPPDGSQAPAIAASRAAPVIVSGLSYEEKARDRTILPYTAARASLPLAVSGKVVGILDLQSEWKDFFTPETVSVLSSLAAYVAGAVRNASLYEMAKEARHEAEEANRMKSRFLANMSHELRTPLNSVINFAYLLGSGAEGEVSDDQRDLASRIEKAGQHLLGLINDILDLAKIEAGRMELSLEECDLRELAEGALSVATGLLRDKPVELRKELPTTIPPIVADRTRVRQILLNLLSNAAKFTDTGSVTLAIEANEANVRISVADTGIGMDPAEAPKAFSEFSQLEDGAARQGGTGLGLPISKRFAELHGGTLTVETAKGKGSTFYVELPIAGPETAARPLASRER